MVSRNRTRYPADLQPWGAHASGICLLRDGTVLVNWYAGTCRGVMEHDAIKGDPLGASRIYLARLSPGSDQFSEPEVLAGEGSVRYMDANLFTDGHGIPWAFYVTCHNKDNRIHYRKATDESGTAWGEQTETTEGVRGRIMNPPLETEGKIWLPVSSFDQLGFAPWKDGEMVVSEDGGQSWKPDFRFVAPDRLVCLREPVVVRWKNELQVYFRVRVYQEFWKIADPSDSRWLAYRSISRDNGKTWSVPVPLEVPNHDCKVSVAVLPDDRLVMAYNPTPDRFPLVLATSTDGGLNWKDEGEIAPGPGSMSYPTMIVDGDGRVHMSYTWKRREIAYTLFEVS